MICEWRYGGSYSLFIVGLVIIATIISSSYSRDSSNYVQMFNIYGASGWGAFSSEVVYRETFVVALSKLIHQLGLGSIYFFLIHAAISVPIKLFLISKYSRDKWLSIALFFSYFFILHDSTQIRFGLSVAFVYLGLSYLANGKKLIFSVIVLFSAIMFHYASLAFIVMLFFTNKNALLWLFGMVIFAVLLYPVNLNINFLWLLGEVTNHFDLHGSFVNKLQRSVESPSQQEYLGMFKPTMILVYLSIFVIYQYRDRFDAYERLCFNALVLTIFFYILFKDTVDLQIRFRDMFFFSLVFLVPFIHEWLSTFMGKRNAYVMLTLSFSVYLAKFIFYDKMIVL